MCNNSTHSSQSQHPHRDARTIPTLREVLGFAPFVDADATVVAGAQALDRTVRWVHCSEMPEVARLFRGGELLLTQGRGLSQSAEEQRQWVDALSEAKIAGVCLEVGVMVDEVPPAVVEHARRRGLPVVALRHPAYFMAMTQAVHSAIVNSRFDALQHAEEVGRRFSRLAMRGAGLQALLDELASVLSRPVVLADGLHQLRAFSPGDDAVVAQLTEWTAHARQGHSYAEGPEDVTSGGLTCTTQSIAFRGELWGSVHVLHAGSELDEWARLALDRGAAAIGMAFAAAEGDQRLDDDARSGLLDDLLLGRDETAQQLHDRAAALGVRLGSKLRVVLVQPLETGSSFQPRTANTRQLRTALRFVAAQIGGGQKERSPDVLVGYAGTRVRALLTDADEAEIRDKLERVVAAAGNLHEPAVLLIGVSEPTTAASLPRAAAEAEEVIRYGLRTGQGARVLTAGSLGVDRLLLKLDEGAALADHIERELGRLLDHDARSGAPLIPTLVAYLELSGQKTRIARRLHIERRSLYHRVTRIRSLIDGDLDDADTRLRLLIAIRGLDYRDRASRRTGPRHTL